MYVLSRKVSFGSKIIDPVINGFISRDVSSHLQICDHSIIIFGIRENCLWFSNTSHVDSLDRFRISVVDKVKKDIFSKKYI